MNVPRTFEWYRTFLDIQRPAVGMAWLNDGVPHRSSAIFHLHDNRFENACLHDKQGQPIQAIVQNIPFRVSCCQYPDSAAVFTTNDSAA